MLIDLIGLNGCKVDLNTAWFNKGEKSRLLLAKLKPATTPLVNPILPIKGNCLYLPILSGTPVWSSDLPSSQLPGREETPMTTAAMPGQ